MKIDWEEVERLSDFFSYFTEEYLSKTPCRVSPHQLISWIHKGEKVIIVDIRTPTEMGLIGFTYPQTLKIPMNELFKRENIEKLAQYEDYKIVVACRAGVRSLVATAFLRRVGFNNAYSLHGGIIAFAEAVKC
jgi:rhodanese-related sulfurtransferase